VRLFNTIMTSSSNPTEVTDEFESTLETLIMESFAKGAAIQGTWEIKSSESAVPRWLVTIEKIDNGNVSGGEQTFLDE